MNPIQHNTLDKFLDGRVVIEQPQKGFRAGIDSVLLAAALPQTAQNLPELGAGAGTAACCMLADIAKAKATLIEKQTEMADLLARNINRNGFTDHTQIIQADVLAPHATLETLGLMQNQFDCVFANPPFFDSGSGTHAPSRSKADANHMPLSDLELWIKRAAGFAAASGQMVMIHDARALPYILAAMENRFGAITLLPIHPRDGEPAHRILVRGIKGSRAPLTIAPPLVLHEDQGRDFTPVANAIFRGQARLHW